MEKYFFLNKQDTDSCIISAIIIEKNITYISPFKDTILL